MRRHLLTAAAVATALVAFAQPASAQQYRSYHDEHVSTQQQCQTSRSNRTAGGAVIGGVLGALLGREVADRGVRGEGAGLGAVVGASPAARSGARRRAAIKFRVQVVDFARRFWDPMKELGL